MHMRSSHQHFQLTERDFPQTVKYCKEKKHKTLTEAGLCDKLAHKSRLKAKKNNTCLPRLNI